MLSRNFLADDYSHRIRATKHCDFFFLRLVAAHSVSLLSCFFRLAKENNVLHEFLFPLLAGQVSFQFIMARWEREIENSRSSRGFYETPVWGLRIRFRMPVTPKPSPWIYFLNTPQAQSRIRQWFAVTKSCLKIAQNLFSSFENVCRQYFQHNCFFIL